MSKSRIANDRVSADAAGCSTTGPGVAVCPTQKVGIPNDGPFIGGMGLRGNRRNAQPNAP